MILQIQEKCNSFYNISQKNYATKFDTREPSVCYRFPAKIEIALAAFSFIARVASTAMSWK